MEINKSIASIIIVVITVIVVFLFVVPQYQESMNLKTAIAQKQAEYYSQSDYYTGILKVLQEVELKQDVLAKINTALPSEFSYAELMYFLQAKAAENQLLVQSIHFSPVAAQPKVAAGHSAMNKKASKEELQDIVFALNFSGTYQSFKKFIVSLEKSSRLFEVTGMSFALQGALIQNQPHIYDFKVEFKTYTY